MLYGSYFYGTTAADYAAKHPERVAAMILWNIDLGPEPRSGHRVHRGRAQAVVGPLPGDLCPDLLLVRGHGVGNRAHGRISRPR